MNLLKSRTSVKEYLYDHKQPSYQVLRRFLPHFQVEPSQLHVGTLFSPLQSKLALMDLFPLLTVCFLQILSYLTYDMGV